MTVDWIIQQINFFIFLFVSKYLLNILKLKYSIRHKINQILPKIQNEDLMRSLEILGVMFLFCPKLLI